MVLNFDLVFLSRLSRLQVIQNLAPSTIVWRQCDTFEYKANRRTLWEGLWLWTLWTRWTIRFVSRPLTARWSVFNFMPNRLVMSWLSGAVAMAVMEFQVCWHKNS